MALTGKMKAFIRKKVKEIGSYEGVKKFYFKDDAVSAYALERAEKKYGVAIRRRKRSSRRPKKAH